MDGTRVFKSIVALIAIGTLALELASWGPLRSSFWGFHLLAFVPLPFAIAIVLATLGGLAILWARVQRTSGARGAAQGAPHGAAKGAKKAAAAATASRRTPAPVQGPAPEAVPALGPLDRLAASPLALPLIMVTSAVLFWTLRCNQTLLGDGWLMVSGLPTGVTFHEREPLATAFVQGAYRLVRSGATGPDAVRESIRAVWLLNSLYGVLFVVVAWGLGREIAIAATAVRGGVESVRTTRWTQILATLVLVSQGYMLLFYGYLEIYAALSFFVAVYAWTALLCLRGRLPLLVPLAVCLLAIGVHLAGVALLPSLVLVAGLALAGRLPARARRAAAWRDVAIGVGAIVALDLVLRSMAMDYSLWKGVRGILRTAVIDHGGGRGLTYAFSLRHLRDFVNEHALLGPFAASLCLPALFVAARERALHTRGLAFVAVAALSLLVGCWFTSEPLLGYARDWDLFAPAGSLFTLCGLWVLCAATPRDTRARLLAAMFLLSAPRLLGWAALNHDEARSATRFAHLPLGNGRTEVTLGNWHLRNGREQEAVQWFEKALRIDPRNSNAYVFLAQHYWRQGDAERAAQFYGQALRFRADKNEYRRDLVNILVSMNRLEEALPHLEVLRQREPHRSWSWTESARVLALLGRTAEGRQMLEAGAAQLEAEVQRRPQDAERVLGLGTLYARLERTDDAARAFCRAAELAPGSVEAVYGCGAALVDLGRGAEAAPFMQRFLALASPQDDRAPTVRAWLEKERAPQ
jgi:Flp pilus assembly protein TadD